MLFATVLWLLHTFTLSLVPAPHPQLQLGLMHALLNTNSYYPTTFHPISLLRYGGLISSQVKTVQLFQQNITQAICCTIPLIKAGSNGVIHTEPATILNQYVQDMIKIIICSEYQAFPQ